MSALAKSIRSEIATCYWGGERRFFTAKGAAKNEARKLYHKIRPRDDGEPIDYARRESFVQRYSSRLLRRFKAKVCAILNGEVQV